MFFFINLCFNVLIFIICRANDDVVVDVDVVAVVLKPFREIGPQWQGQKIKHLFIIIFVLPKRTTTT